MATRGISTKTIYDPRHGQSDRPRAADQPGLPPRLPFLKILEHAAREHLLFPIGFTLSKTPTHEIHGSDGRYIHDCEAVRVRGLAVVHLFEPDEVPRIEAAKRLECMSMN